MTMTRRKKNKTKKKDKLRSGLPLGAVFTGGGLYFTKIEANELIIQFLELFRQFEKRNPDWYKIIPEKNRGR